MRQDIHTHALLLPPPHKHTAERVCESVGFTECGCGHIHRSESERERERARTFKQMKLANERWRVSGDRGISQGVMRGQTARNRSIYVCELYQQTSVKREKSRVSTKQKVKELTCPQHHKVIHGNSCYLVEAEAA